MNRNLHALLPYVLCTTMALFANPAFAHDGPHQLTALQALLHDLAYADYLPAALALAAAAAIAIAVMVARTTAGRMARHKAARSQL